MISMTQRLIATATLVLAALPVYAQEHAAEETGLSPFAGNVGNAIWTLAIFLLVLTILGKFAGDRSWPCSRSARSSSISRLPMRSVIARRPRRD
jgi:hypothetical protein